MKRLLFTALIVGALSSHAAYAGCTIGDPEIDPPRPLPPPPVTIGPYLEVNTLWASTTRIEDYTDIPTAHLPYFESEYEFGVLESQVVEFPPVSLLGEETTPPPPDPPRGGGGACDSVTTSMPSDHTREVTYLQRELIDAGIYRHVLQLDLNFLQGNGIHPNTTRWPFAEWRIPMQSGEIPLRIDFVGAKPGLSLPYSGIQVFWDNNLIATEPVSVLRPIIELKWADDGEMLLLMKLSAGSKIDSLPLYSDQGRDFRPSSARVGRVSMPSNYRPSHGYLYVQSHLIESPPAQTEIPGDEHGGGGETGMPQQ